MVYIIGASCRHKVTQSLTYNNRKKIKAQSTSISGLSLNLNARNPLKVVQNLFKNQGVLRQRNDIIIWHHITNNSITAHSSNYCPNRDIYRPLSPRKLVRTLENLKKKYSIKAVVYTRRQGTPGLSIALRDNGILILEVQKNLLLRKEKRNPELLCELNRIHPQTAFGFFGFPSLPGFSFDWFPLSFLLSVFLCFVYRLLL